MRRAKIVGVDTPEPSLRGRLLVAAPPLVDPNFDRTVVLMLEHGEDGALGIVLNRPSETALDDVLPEWRVLASAPDGRVRGRTGRARSGDRARATAHADAIDGWVPILDDLGTIDLATDPLDLGAPLDELRVFVGYAGWGPGQLEANSNRARGSWSRLEPRRSVRVDTRAAVARRAAPPARHGRDVRELSRGRDGELRQPRVRSSTGRMLGRSLAGAARERPNVGSWSQPRWARSASSTACTLVRARAVPASERHNQFPPRSQPAPAVKNIGISSPAA